MGMMKTRRDEDEKKRGREKRGGMEIDDEGLLMRIDSQSRLAEVVVVCVCGR